MVLEELPSTQETGGVQAARQLPHRNGLPGRVQERPDGPRRPRRATQAAFWLQRRLSCQYPARNSAPLFPTLESETKTPGAVTKDQSRCGRIKQSGLILEGGLCSSALRGNSKRHGLAVAAGGPS